MFRYGISSLMLLMAVIAVGLGAGRLWFHSRAPLELERAFAHCDRMRIQYPTRSAQSEEIILTWDITDQARIGEIRTLLALPFGQVDATGEVIMGGPALGVTLFEKDREMASFYFVDCLLTTPAYPEYKQRSYVLPSGEAWNVLLEMSQSR